MWKLFNNSPARRDLYINLNRSYNFSLMFCQMRCVEDKSVASRATGVWKLVVSVINHCKSLPKSKCPENKSYDLLVKHMTNNLMLMKFQFFKDSVSTIILSYKISNRCSEHAFSVRLISEKFRPSNENVFYMQLFDVFWSRSILRRKKIYCLFDSVKVPIATKSLLVSIKVQVKLVQHKN